MHQWQRSSTVTTWAPAIGIYETEHELVLKVDLPDVEQKDIDIPVENNMFAATGNSSRS